MSKKRNLIILSIYLLVLVLSGVIYTIYNNNSNDVPNLRIDSIEPNIFAR